jgi:hypothetical protein
MSFKNQLVYLKYLPILQNKTQNFYVFFQALIRDGYPYKRWFPTPRSQFSLLSASATAFQPLLDFEEAKLMSGSVLSFAFPSAPVFDGYSLIVFLSERSSLPPYVLMSF